MRFVWVVCTALLLCGCFGKRKSGHETSATTTGAPNAVPAPGANQSVQKLVVTPETALVGRVASVNTSSRFVVLNFPLGRLPGVEQHLNLYRSGSKVGEVKITGPQHDDNIVADLVTGDAAVGDQVRGE
jgi:hypothetical protein